MPAQDLGKDDIGPKDAKNKGGIVVNRGPSCHHALSAGKRSVRDACLLLSKTRRSLSKRGDLIEKSLIIVATPVGNVLLLFWARKEMS